MAKGLLLQLYYGFGTVISYPFHLSVFTAVCWVMAIVGLALILRRVIAINDLQHTLEMLEVTMNQDRSERYLYYNGDNDEDEEWRRWRGRVQNLLTMFPTRRNYLFMQKADWLIQEATGLARDGEILDKGKRVRAHWLLPPSDVGMASYEYEKEVLDFVQDGASSLLGIWGMRGVGKTTLLRFVRDSYSHGFCFSHVFFLGAGTGCTVDRLQHVLSVNIGRPMPQVSNDVPMAQVISSYLKPRTFLLLLDDVREKIDLAAVGLPMPPGYWQKVIFTTRNQAICAEMGCTSNTINLKALGREDAFKLFCDKVGDEIISAHPHIKHLANKMVSECRGLPSALCTLGRAMSTKRDVKEWRYAYDVLLKSKPPQVGDEIQDMDDQGYSHLHRLEDTLQEPPLRSMNVTWELPTDLLANL